MSLTRQQLLDAPIGARIQRDQGRRYHWTKETSDTWNCDETGARNSATGLTVEQYDWVTPPQLTVFELGQRLRTAVEKEAVEQGWCSDAQIGLDRLRIPAVPGQVGDTVYGHSRIRALPLGSILKFTSEGREGDQYMVRDDRDDRDYGTVYLSGTGHLPNNNWAEIVWLPEFTRPEVQEDTRALEQFIRDIRDTAESIKSDYGHQNHVDRIVREVLATVPQPETRVAPAVGGQFHGEPMAVAALPVGTVLQWIHDNGTDREPPTFYVRDDSSGNPNKTLNLVGNGQWASHVKIIWLPPVQISGVDARIGTVMNLVTQLDELPAGAVVAYTSGSVQYEYTKQDDGRWRRADSGTHYHSGDLSLYNNRFTLLSLPATPAVPEPTTTEAAADAADPVVLRTLEEAEALPVGALIGYDGRRLTYVVEARHTCRRNDGEIFPLSDLNLRSGLFTVLFMPGPAPAQVLDLEQARALPVGSTFAYNNRAEHYDYIIGMDGQAHRNDGHNYRLSDLYWTGGNFTLISATPVTDRCPVDGLPTAEQLAAAPVGTVIRLNLTGSRYRKITENSWRGETSRVNHGAHAFLTPSTGRNDSYLIVSYPPAVELDRTIGSVDEADQLPVGSVMSYNNLVSDDNTSWTKQTDGRWRSERGLSYRSSQLQFGVGRWTLASEPVPVPVPADPAPVNPTLPVIGDHMTRAQFRALPEGARISASTNTAEYLEKTGERWTSYLGGDRVGSHSNRWVEGYLHAYHLVSLPAAAMPF